MTPAFVKMRLRDCGLGQHAYDDVLVAWIVEALRTSFEDGAKSARCTSPHHEYRHMFDDDDV